MPFIVSRVSSKMTDEEKNTIRDGYLENLQSLLGKSKDFVMLDLQDECPLYVRGEENSKGAYIEINLYGYNGGLACAELSKIITNLYADTLGLDPDNIFINFRDVTDFSINGDFY